jgi:spermidine synthase
LKSARHEFASAQYAQISVPSYPSGTIGALVMRKSLSAESPQFPSQVMSQLTYFTPEVYVAQFALPRFVRDRLSQ